MKKNKTLMTGLIIAMVVILLALIGYIVYEKVSDYQEEKKMMKEFHETLENDDLSIIYYMHTGCEFCAMEEPILERIADDYEFDYLTIDSSLLSKKEKQEVLDTLDIEGKTPTIVILKNGEVKATHVGYLEGYKLVEFFIKAEVLDEGSTYKPEEGLTFIAYDKWVELQDQEEPYVVVLGSATCEFCKAVRPILSNLSKAYNIPIYYLGLNYLGQDNGAKFEEQLQDMKYDEESFIEEGKYTTPAVLIIKNKRVISHKEGYQEATDYITYFKEQKIIKE